MDLTTLLPADIPEVMRIERMPGYEAVVGRFEADEHTAQMATPDVRYVGFRDGAGLAGFAILHHLGAPEVLLRRIAVGAPDQGVGTRLVRAVMAHVFETTPARAMVLDVALANARARHVYERHGFVWYDADDVHHFMRAHRERWALVRQDAGPDRRAPGG